MTSDVIYLTLGGALLLAVVLPEVLGRVALSTPMVLVGAGVLLGLTPLAEGLSLDPGEIRPVIEHVTELTVIVALMGVGLAIDRPLDLRRRESRREWSTTWRLLGVAMPLSIAATALLGWWAGLAPASALLLGAVLAPTDPVLASEVQVAGPATGGRKSEEDELRFSLTSEAGLNDGLAFPFVYAAVFAASGPVAGWAWEWVGIHLLGKVAVGLLAGLGCGWLLARVAFRSRSRSLRAAERGDALLAVAALLTSYGVGEVLGGYGFLSVFACAMTFRSFERDHAYQASLHQVVERLERLLTLVVLLVLGVALSRGLLDALDWRGVAVGLSLLLVVRPVTAWLALTRPVARGAGRLEARERAAVAFFGVRGIGSLYYLSYAAGEESFASSSWIWSCVGFTVVASVVLHGVTATPVMRRLTSSAAT